MLYTYSSENSSSELAVIKSAGYDEVFSSALLDAIANWNAIRLSSAATSASSACETYVHDFIHKAIHINVHIICFRSRNLKIFIVKNIT